MHRLDWERQAWQVGAYRGKCSAGSTTSEPIGPEPVGDFPEKRSAWRDAFAAMLRVDGADLRGAAEGSLWKMRATYEAETTSAPAHVGRELRAMRQSAVASST